MIEFSERIRRIPVYPVAGGYQLPEDVALMASNETPDPPLPAVLDAITRALPTLNRYPDPAGTKLRRALADRYGVPAERIALGNAWPSFSVYPHLAAASGARAIVVGLDERERHDLDPMATEITVATRLVVVCNPNNPTSTAVSLEEIGAFLERVPRHVAVILDEAYCEFNLLDDPDATLDLLPQFPNLVLLRTFSKVYGLCGLRVGFGLCGSAEFKRAVDQVRQPFFCNAAAQAAALEALRHQDEVAERVERNVARRLQIDAGLRDLGLQPAESQANFAWFDLPSPEVEDDVVGGLSERGVLVRAGSALGKPGALRVTYGTAAQNERFLHALRDLL